MMGEAIGANTEPWGRKASINIGTGLLLPYLSAGVVFFCALAIPFNVILLSLSGQDLRLLDVVSLAVLPMALWLTLQRVHLLLSFVVLGIVFLLPSLVLAVVLLVYYDDFGDFVFPARFLMAIVLCGALVPLLENTLHRTWFAIGMCLGCCLNIIPLVFERLGQHKIMVALGLAPGQLALHPWDIELRPPGLHGHANATTAVVSLAIPAAAFMASSQRKWWLLPVAVSALLVCIYYTETRSAALISLATLGLAIAFSWRLASILMLALMLGFLGLIMLGWNDGPLLSEDFTRLDTAGENLTERLATMVAGLRIMLEQPWGVGRTLGGSAVYDLTGVAGVTAFGVVSIPMHNSFIWLGVTFGLVPAVFTVAGLVIAATHAGRIDATGLRGLLAFHLLGLCLFEDHFQNATFIALQMLLLGGWLAELLAGARNGAVDVPGANCRTPYPEAGMAGVPAWRGTTRNSP